MWKGKGEEILWRNAMSVNEGGFEFDQRRVRLRGVIDKGGSEQTGAMSIGWMVVFCTCDLYYQHFLVVILYPIAEWTWLMRLLATCEKVSVCIRCIQKTLFFDSSLRSQC